MKDVSGYGSIGQAGFTLLEVLVALTLFLIVSALMAPVFVAHLKYNLEASQKSGAIVASQQALDELRVQDVTGLPLSGTVGPTNMVVGERTYQVLTTYCLNASWCTATARHITVNVSFKNKSLFTTETVYALLQ